MIAHLSTILYIISTTEQPLPKKILQKGIAACKTNNNGDFLTFKYTLWLPNTTNDNDNYIEKIRQETTYFTTGKFTMLPDKTLELVISSCKTLPITKESDTNLQTSTGQSQRTMQHHNIGLPYDIRSNTIPIRRHVWTNRCRINTPTRRSS